MLELLILTKRYSEGHTFEYVYEREISDEVQMGTSPLQPEESVPQEDIFGIGIQGDSLFWFHQETEMKESE